MFGGGSSLGGHGGPGGLVGSGDRGGRDLPSMSRELPMQPSSDLRGELCGLGLGSAGHTGGRAGGLGEGRGVPEGRGGREELPMQPREGSEGHADLPMQLVIPNVS